MKRFMSNVTPEQRLLMKEKTKQKKEAMKAAAKLLKTDYTDMPHWEGLAREAGVRLPQHIIPSTETKYLKRMCKKLNVDIQDYLESCGVSTIKQLIALNPLWTARAECGMLLEWNAER